ncbi:type IX secretion system plug protein [Algoriphagus namhaensis]
MYKIFLFLLLFPLTLFAQTENKVYQDHIQSVRLFPLGTEVYGQLDAPVVPLGSSKPLILLFDDIAYDPEQYSAKLIHCDANWEKSQLRDNDFLPVFNEFNVQNYTYSINTRIPYVHYRFQVPKVTKSGNYVLKIYRGRDESQVMLTRRFMVYENLFPVGAAIVPPTDTENRSEKQQLNIVVNYSKGQVMNPSEQMTVVIRQNQRWDNAKYINKPTFLNESSKIMRYESFEGDNTFFAGNEFRFIDLRFIRATGVNISSIQVEEDRVEAMASIDAPRGREPYSQYLDLNGQYLVFTNDRVSGNHDVESEYVLTTFNLSIPQTGQPVYLIGALTNWGASKESRMVWNEKFNVYQTTLLLKQGWYDYQYAIRESEEKFETYAFEGSYFQTENEYEVLVYFRNLGSRYDQLVGYVYLQPNRRRL